MPPASEAGEGPLDAGSEHDEIEEFTPPQQGPPKRKAQDDGGETGASGTGASEAKGLRAVVGPVNVVYTPLSHSLTILGSAISAARTARNRRASS